MKKIFILLWLILLPSLFSSAKKYYPVWTCDNTGNSHYCSEGYVDFEITPNSLIDKTENKKYVLIGVYDNGDRHYECKYYLGQIPFKRTIIISSDKKNARVIGGAQGQPSWRTDYVDDKAKKDRLYTEHFMDRTEGIDFSMPSNSRSSNDTPSTKRNSISAANCPHCHGTGVDLSPSSGGGRASHLAHYNSSGQVCPYCGRKTKHYHYKCIH